jgi:hypothetical protein
MISAHDGPLVAMSFDMSGTRIATASNKVCQRNWNIVNTLKYIMFKREQWFEFIVLLMAHVYLSFVVEFDGIYFDDDDLFMSMTVSELQQSIHWYSVLIQCFWQHQVTQKQSIYFVWRIQQQSMNRIWRFSFSKVESVCIARQKKQVPGWVRLVVY